MADSKKEEKVFFPMYVLNWIFGMGLIEYPPGTFHPYISFFYSTLCISVYCLISAVAYPYIIASVSISSNILQVKIFYFSSILLTVSFVALGWYHSEGMQKCIRKSKIVDDLMKDLGIPINRRRMLRCFMGRLTMGTILIFLLVITNLMVAFVQNTSIKARILTIFTVCYPILTMFIADSTFILFISTSSYKFHKLNVGLKSFFTITTSVYPRHKPRPAIQSDGKEGNINNILVEERRIDEESNLNIIKLAKQIHFQLDAICKEANKTYGLQILLSITVAFGVITINMYNAYTLLQDNVISNKRKLVEVMISSFAWTLYFTARMWAYSWACSWCMKKSSKTGDIINKVYDDPSIDSETQDEIRDFNVQLIQSPLRFSACGFVNLDYSLMRVMVSTITTNLMILIQLRSEVK